jgi:hypothetical protein
LIRQKAEPYEYEINKISAKDPEAETKIKRLLVKLRNLRQAGLDAAGEYSVENLAFKYLRNKGLLDRLKEMLHAITTNQLIIDEDGQYHRCDLVKHSISKLTDTQAKALMLTRLQETYNI